MNAVSHEGNGEARVYRVIVSGKVREHVYKLKEVAKDAGIKDLFLSTLRSLVQRLRTDPHQVGEPLRRVGKFLVHIALLNQIKLEFGIHEELPLVWITEIDLVL